MDAATLAAIKKGVNLAKKGIEYIEHDNKVMLGLRKPQWITFEGPGIGRGDFDNGVLCIASVKGENAVRLDARVFSAWLKAWNGPDLIDNKVKDGRLESSLWHDLIWFYAKDIAAAWGCTAVEVMEWANGLFFAAWKDYGEHYPSARFVDQKARIAYGAVHFSAPWYHRFKKLFSLSVVILCVCGGCEGCAFFDPAPNDIHVTGSSGTFGDDVESVEPWVSTNSVQGVR